MTALKKN